MVLDTSELYLEGDGVSLHRGPPNDGSNRALGKELGCELTSSHNSIAITFSSLKFPTYGVASLCVREPHKDERNGYTWPQSPNNLDMVVRHISKNGNFGVFLSI